MASPRSVYEVKVEANGKSHTVIFSSVNHARNFAYNARHRGWKATEMKVGDICANETEALNECRAMLESHR